jgi:hypothetical protein
MFTQAADENLFIVYVVINHDIKSSKLFRDRFVFSFEGLGVVRQLSQKIKQIWGGLGKSKEDFPCLLRNLRMKTEKDFLGVNLSRELLNHEKAAHQNS